ncbi:MAG: GNAT family N-acetyltransferase [Verrucomicrobiales bacterium]|nr:GNAT family N-acetyltransferase [Verrucomicrobiales bacterium]
MDLSIETALPEDFDDLVELRLEAMKESLEAIGRFDRDRSIERFRKSFDPENTRKIRKEGILAGFIATTHHHDHIHLDHLYVAPSFQSSGIGSLLMQKLVETSEAKGLPIRLGALRASKSNSFYQRQGFVVLSEDEWDTYYERAINPDGL